MGVPQELPESKTRNGKVQQLLRDSREYMQKEVNAKGLKVGVVDMCRNQNEKCAIWALDGECDANPACKCIHVSIVAISAIMAPNKF